MKTVGNSSNSGWIRIIINVRLEYVYDVILIGE